MIRYTEKQKSEILYYICMNFGQIDEVYTINGFDDIELEMAVINPTEERDFYTVVTVGFGAHTMNVPDDVEGNEQLRRCELVITLPKDWMIDSMNRESYWPMGYMQDIVRMVINENSWIGPMHTVDFGEEVPDSNMRFSGVLIIPPNLLYSKIFIEDDFINQDLQDVNMYYVYPLYREELDLKVRLGGYALYERIIKLIDEAMPIDRNRISVGERYKKKHFKTSDEITSINYSGPNGCLVTDSIMVDGNKVGYCYREEPEEQEFWDSGWRFVSEKESREELNDKSKINICSLNEVVAIDEEVEILLDSPYQSVYQRDENGMFRSLEQKNENYNLRSVDKYQGDYEIVEDGMIHMDTVLCKHIDVPEINGLSHIATFIIWAMKNGLLSEKFMEENKEILQEVAKNGTKAPLREYLYSNFDAQLRDVFFSEKGLRFVGYYYNNDRFTTPYTRNIDEYAMKIFGEERYRSDEFKNEAYVFLEYDEEYYNGVEEYINKTYNHWNENIYSRSLEPVMREEEIEKISGFLDGDEGYFWKMTDYLDALGRELVDTGVFTNEEIFSDLEYSLWLLFAVINMGVYDYMQWVRRVVAIAEPNAKGSGKWFYRYAVLLTNVGELEEALEYAKRGVKEEPEYPWGWLHLAKLQAHFGEKESALKSLEQGECLVEYDEAHEFRTLREDILKDATIEKMMFHLISEEDDKNINSLKCAEDFAENEAAKEQYEKTKYLTIDEEGMEERRYIFNDASLRTGDTFVCLTKILKETEKECYLYIRNVNPQYFSKMDKEVLQFLANIMEDSQWAIRTLSDGHRYYLEGIVTNSWFRTGVVFRRDDGIEVMIELTEERQDFSEEIKLEEIDLRIAMKVREILEEKENIKQ